MGFIEEFPLYMNILLPWNKPITINFMKSPITNPLIPIEIEERTFWSSTGNSKFRLFARFTWEGISPT